MRSLSATVASPAWSTGRLVIAALAFCGLLVGCAQNVQVQQAVLKPAESTQATKVRRIAVLPFQAPSRDLDASPDLEAALASVVIDGKPYFTVVERTRIGQAINELRFGEKPLVDPASAARVGKLIGAEGIYTGVVSRGAVSDRPFQDTRNKCTRFERKKDKKGNTVDGKCLKWEDYNVRCTERTATFSMVPKLIRVQTGEIAFSEAIEGTASDKYCQGDEGGLADQAKLLASARSSAIDTFKRKVAPTMQTVAVVFMNGADGITAPEARTKHEGALEYAKLNRTDRACELWNQAVTEDPRSHLLIHNAGACLEVDGRLDDALAAYQRADRASPKPDKTILQAIDRVQQQQRNQVKLQGQVRTKN